MNNKNLAVPVKVPTIYFLNLYSEVKIYKAKEIKNGKKELTLDKHWFVYYYYRSPYDNKMKKFIEKRGINRSYTIAERTKYAKYLKSAVTRWLQEGYSPYGHISEGEVQENYTVIEAIEHAIVEKSKLWNGQSKVNGLSKCSVFKQWLLKTKISSRNIKEIKKRHISQFLNNISSVTGNESSTTNRNNYRATIHSLFAQLVSDDILEINFVSTIPKLATKPVKNKAFDKTQLIAIKKYLKKNDPYLLYYIQFIMYAFLRPVEVTRIKIGDINLDYGILEVRTKTEANSTVLIIDKLKSVIKGMKPNYNERELNLFSNLEKPAKWVTTREKSKSDFFIRKFKKLKEELNLGTEYGLYSFRHTFTLDLYNSFLEQGLTQLEAKHKLMTITRHKSLSGLENYLRDVGAVLPKDYSKDYTMDF